MRMGELPLTWLSVGRQRRNRGSWRGQEVMGRTHQGEAHKELVMGYSLRNRGMLMMC